MSTPGGSSFPPSRQTGLRFSNCRFRTEAHQDVVHRFNERFILSLASNNSCVFLDDNLNILPLSSHVKTLEKVTGVCPVSDREEELRELKTSLQDTQPVGALVNQTR